MTSEDSKEKMLKEFLALVNLRLMADGGNGLEPMVAYYLRELFMHGESGERILLNCLDNEDLLLATVRLIRESLGPDGNLDVQKVDQSLQRLESESKEHRPRKKRVMELKKVAAAGDSLDEARKGLKRQISEGYCIISETISPPGAPRTIERRANTADRALGDALSRVPLGTRVIKKEVVEPHKWTKEIESYDKDGALARAKELASYRGSVEACVLKTEGKRGFLGIGKKPHSYEVTIALYALARVTFQDKTIIRATIGPVTPTEPKKLYPHPKIDLYYKCECGEKCQFSSREVDFEKGINVMCRNCGRITFISPSIFDRNRPHPHDPSGAYIHADWYMRLQPPRPL